MDRDQWGVGNLEQRCNHFYLSWALKGGVSQTVSKCLLKVCVLSDISQLHLQVGWDDATISDQWTKSERDMSPF